MGTTRTARGTKTALVVNCSASDVYGRPRHFYNLGALKLADWLRAEGYTVHVHHGDPGLFAEAADLICLSVIFSWHAPLARDIAVRVKDRAEVWCGGPGMYALWHWWAQETGLEIVRGLDPRFDRMRGDYHATFASRGCPVGCSFCIVPRLEGTAFTLDWDFRPAPILCDNNLSALPDDFQEHILDRYRHAGVELRDANSGFEPRAFTEATYRRWAPQLRGPWRFAFDERREAADVERMMGVLRDVPARRKQVWLLTGNESVEECYDRAMRVLQWGGEPFCQFVLPLNWLGNPADLRPRHDWTWQRGKDFCRYFNRRLWRSIPLEEYRPRLSEAPPIARGLRSGHRAA